MKQPHSVMTQTPASLTASRDYQRIAAALEYLAEQGAKQPSLHEIAQHIGLSEFHFQRLFQRWVGISPKRFLQHLSLEAAKASLRRSSSLLDAAFDAGLSGAGRLHDLFVTYEALTPGEFKRRGEGLHIRYGFHDSPFGECLLLLTERGICGLQFVTTDRETCLAEAQQRWAAAEFLHAPTETGALIPHIFRTQPGHSDDIALKLFVRGSRFQIKVWQALLEIPVGGLMSYGQLAEKLGYAGNTQCARAIGRANAENLIAWLIPCHRVIRQTGAYGGYRWGQERKLAMIGWEAARVVD